MKKNKLIFIIALLICLLGLLLISTYLYINDTNKKENTTKISVIVYGNSSDRWATLRQGIDQGAADFKAEVSFVTMIAEDDAREQEMLIAREIANGAKGIILAAVNSKEITQKVNEAALIVPIVMVETNVEDAVGLRYISADNYSMGLNIGRSVYLSSDENKKVAIFKNNMHRNSIHDRYKGLMDSLQYTEYSISPWETSEEEIDASLYLQRMIKENPVDVIVALDDKSLETVIDAVEASESVVDVYGIGSSKKIVHYLDYGIISSLVFQNEFNMGYLSIQEVINKMNGNKNVPNIDIEFRTVNRETMYLPKNQRLVFPIVQ